MLPRRLLTLLTALPLALIASGAYGQGIGISNGFAYTSDVADTTASPYLPSLPNGMAGAHGFLKNDGEGNFIFDDGTPVRFFGVNMHMAACFPDSAQAIMTAARLRKLGVNMVRFVYMDNAYDWGPWGQERTFLDAATGFRTLHAGQMRKLDWFIYQLKIRGIYSYITLQSMRAARASDGLGADADSALWLGHELNYLYPQARATNKLVARLLLDHVNSFTSVPYKSEPAIAMLEAMEQGSMITMYRLGYTEYRPTEYGFSWRHSRRLDTLYTEFLKSKYGSTAALAAAWKTPIPTEGFPNLMQEGSFEGDFDRHWYVEGYDGVSVSQILTDSDTIPAGEYALKLRIRNAGDPAQGGSYMVQALPLEYNTVYRLSFKAKTSDPGGRAIGAYGQQATEAYLYAGLNKSFQITSGWQEHEAFFIVPIRSTVPINITLSLGSRDGDLLIDDIQIKKYDAPGVVPGEALETYNVGRIPAGNGVNQIVSVKRSEDQGEFYLTLEKNYYNDMRRFVRDTVGAKQPYTGAGHFWASTFMEATVEGAYDFTYSAKGWDYISGDATNWQVRNISQLRQPYAAVTYEYALGAHRRQPFIASFGQPFPNRYQAEGLMTIPAYSLLQDYDGFIWDSYADNPLTPNKYIDSLTYTPMAKNPVVTTLMPAISHLFRGRLLDAARTTIGLQHSEQQAKIFPRLETFWGGYAVPGGVPGRAMAANRIVIDSVNAVHETQYDDIAFTPEVEGQTQSDTRQILWEYLRGTISFDAPRVQGTSGALTRAGGITLRHLDVNLVSGNETATILWVPLDTAQKLNAAGKSLLVVTSRTEPTGWRWSDSTHADRWGAGPMLFDPVRVRLAFKPGDISNVAMITPLDSTGMPASAPLRFVRSGNRIEATLDQSTTPAIWYAVELLYDAAASVEPAKGGEILTAQPSIVTDRTYIGYTLSDGARDARIELFDALGRVVRTLHAGPAEAGEHSIRLDAAELPAGAYIVRLETESGAAAIAKITVVR